MTGDWKGKETEEGTQMRHEVGDWREADRANKSIRHQIQLTHVQSSTACEVISHT